MDTGQIVFAQFMDLLPRHAFNRCVNRYHQGRSPRRLSYRDQFLAMAFAQLTGRESLRDIEGCLRVLRPKLYRAGFRCKSVARSTLADANDRRNWRIWADLASVLIAQARTQHADTALDVGLAQTIYAFDSTTIDLCLTLFPWAHFKKTKAGVKLHTLLDLRGNIPCFIRMTNANVNDIKALDDLPIEPGAFYLMDRGYIDYARLYRFEQAKAHFVIRARKNLRFAVRASRPIDKDAGLRCDQTIVLAGDKSLAVYPDRLRRVRYTDPDTGQRLVLLTNCFTLDAWTIAELYRARWQVELFFKWIKGHLRIKAFFGTSPNALRTQIWIAVCVYVLIAELARSQEQAPPTSEILKVLGVALFEKTPLKQVILNADDPTSHERDYKQLWLFDF